MTSKFVEIGPGQNLLPTIKEADQADNFLIGSYVVFLQWSVSQKKVTKFYGGFKDSMIQSMAKTSDKNYLFLASDKGC
jgi:WD40 repeat protein